MVMSVLHELQFLPYPVGLQGVCGNCLHFADEVFKCRLTGLRVGKFGGKTAHEGGLFNARPQFGDSTGG